MGQAESHDDSNMMKTPTKSISQDASLTELSPNLVAAILDSDITKAQLRPNKICLDKNPNVASRQELAEAVLLTAAKRHCENEDRQGLDALKLLVNATAIENINANKKCNREWNMLVESTLGWLTGSTGFLGENQFLMAAILDSDMTCKQLQTKVNKEFLPPKPAGGSPTKVELTEALIRTAAKRHCNNGASAKDMGALQTLLDKSAQENVSSDCSCAEEWSHFVLDTLDSPVDVASTGGIFVNPLDEVGETAKKLEYECDTEEDEGSSCWPHTGMKLSELKEMATERGVDEGSIEDKRKLISWVGAIVATYSRDELKQMATALEVPEPAANKSYKSTWSDAIMGTM